MALLSYKFRLYPNRAQRNELAAMLGAFCDLYNAALQQRIERWATVPRASSSHHEQTKLRW